MLDKVIGFLDSPIYFGGTVLTMSMVIALVAVVIALMLFLGFIIVEVKKGRREKEISRYVKMLEICLKHDGYSDDEIDHFLDDNVLPAKYKGKPEEKTDEKGEVEGTDGKEDSLPDIENKPDGNGKELSEVGENYIGESEEESSTSDKGDDIEDVMSEVPEVETVVPDEVAVGVSEDTGLGDDSNDGVEDSETIFPDIETPLNNDSDLTKMFEGLETVDVPEDMSDMFVHPEEVSISDIKELVSEENGIISEEDSVISQAEEVISEVGIPDVINEGISYDEPVFERIENEDEAIDIFGDNDIVEEVNTGFSPNVEQSEIKETSSSRIDELADRSNKLFEKMILNNEGVTHESSFRKSRGFETDGRRGTDRSSRRTNSFDIKSIMDSSDK